MWSKSLNRYFVRADEYQAFPHFVLRLGLPVPADPPEMDQNVIVWSRRKTCGLRTQSWTARSLMPIAAGCSIDSRPACPVNLQCVWRCSKRHNGLRRSGLRPACESESDVRRSFRDPRTVPPGVCCCRFKGRSSVPGPVERTVRGTVAVGRRWWR